jgi:hypothetical protein
VVAKVSGQAQSGSVYVVTVGGAESNQWNLTVTRPNITSLSTPTAVAGQQVTITGTGFGATAGSVALGTAWAAIVSWGDTQVVAKVSGEAQSGSAYVVTAGGAQSNQLNLTVTRPNITSINPTTAVGGQQVTITGTGFGATAGSVALGTAWAGIVSWSDTQVVAKVSGQAQSGSVYVVTAGGAQSNQLNLTITGPIVSFSPGSISFGNQGVGTKSSAYTLTLKNTGNASLTINSLGVTGANAGDFFTSNNTCGSSVAAGANCTISVSFKPSASGSRGAALSLTDNAYGSPQTVSLSGKGV